MAGAVTRELRVASSRKVQPLWVRVIKWSIFEGVAMALFRTKWFWGWVAGLPFFGLALHFFYRWKTGGWTRSWGGWDDVDSGR